MMRLSTRPGRALRITLLSAAAVLVAGYIGQLAAAASGVFDQIDLLVDVRHEIVSQYVEEPPSQKMVESAVRGMVESLDDPYTVYLSPQELEPFDKAVRGTFSGIGAEVDIHQDRLRIISPLEDSPAWKAGLMAGDIVLEIDGQSTEGLKITECIQKLTGEEGTDVTVRVRHESGEEATYTITRARINIQTVRGFRRDAAGQWDFMLDDAQKVGYVRITQFTDSTAENVAAAVKKLVDQQAAAIILDVRFNPGGLLESAIEVSDLFLPEGKTIVSVKGRTVPEQVTKATAGGIAEDTPLIVIANDASASAAEIVTGALADNDRATFIGTRTFGKGSVQQVRMLDEARGAIKITNAYYYLPSGRNIHRKPDASVWGVDPKDGFYVPMDIEAVRKMLQARRAGEVLRAPGNGEPAADGNAPAADADPAVTPQWIDEKLADPQLSAALRAALDRIQTGDWHAVGEGSAAELTKLAERQKLTLQRDLLRDRLDEIEAQLAKAGGAVGDEAGENKEQE